MFKGTLANISVFENLQELNISCNCAKECPQLTDSEILPISTKCKKLETITLKREITFKIRNIVIY